MKTESEIRDRLKTLEEKQAEGSFFHKLGDIKYKYRLLQIQVLRWVLDLE